jgi:hypothetical protein
MATIVPAITPLPAPGEVRGFVVAWGPMANGDVGLPVQFGAFADRSIQVEGAFGSGGNAEIQGSNDGVNFHPLHDPLGNLLDVIAAGDKIRHVMEITYLLRPAITAGDGTTSLTVTVFVAGSVSRLSIGAS